MGQPEMAYREYMSDTMSISASAWAIFCSEEIWGWRLKRKDMLVVVWEQARRRGRKRWIVWGCAGLNWA